MAAASATTSSVSRLMIASPSGQVGQWAPPLGRRATARAIPCTDSRGREAVRHDVLLLGLLLSRCGRARRHLVDRRRVEVLALQQGHLRRLQLRTRSRVRLLGRLRHELNVRRLLGAVLLLARVEAAPPAQPSEREPAPAPPRGPRRPLSRGVSPRAVRSSAAAYVAAGTGVARRSSGAAADGDGVAMRVASAGRHGGRGSMRRRHPPLVVEQLLRGRVGERQREWTGPVGGT